jgi:hypothetical protein
MTISAPGLNLRQFCIGGEEHTIHDDEIYYLIFSRSGEMIVRIHYSPNKQYGRTRWGDPILPADFARHTIEGVRLDQVVAEFLDKKLPAK